METVVFLGVLISSVVILLATFDIERIEGEDEFALVTQTELSNIKNLCEEVSNSFGDVLLGYLMHNATITPKLIRDVFPNKTIILVSGMIKHVPILVGLLIASASSKRVSFCSKYISSIAKDPL